ncbi:MULTISPECIES: ion channel [unclassified Streptomyces]|uniref:potassium channel family protein n=1 Tax=unclassified Streptomyces TaxID=2593676 RepID=UPI002B1D6F36|nr:MULTISPECIES: ion channel [unclassified Streptomyces]
MVAAVVVAAVVVAGRSSSSGGVLRRCSQTGEFVVRRPHGGGTARGEWLSIRRQGRGVVRHRVRSYGIGRVREGIVDRKPRSGRRVVVLTMVRCSLVVAALVAAYYLLPLDSAFTARSVLALVGGLVAVALLMGWQVRVIMRSERPRLRAMAVLATMLPLFLLLFATTDYLLDRSAPDSFSEALSRTDALYFTMTVFSTVGFGDISPRSETARLLVTGQITANLLLLGVAARILVHAVEEGQRAQREAD